MAGFGACYNSRQCHDWEHGYPILRKAWDREAGQQTSISGNIRNDYCESESITMNKSLDQPERAGAIEDSESDAAPASQEFGLSGGLKLAFVLVFGIPAGLALALLVRYGLRTDAKPSELGLGAVLIFCLACLAAVLVPWRLFGMCLKKIGPLEFEQVISTQKREQSESVTFLQAQIDEVRAMLKTKQGSSVEHAESTPSNIALPDLLEKFLRAYPGRRFSPLFIRNWGSEQTGFKQLDSFSKEEITQSLLAMLAANRVRTGISKKGNTLYYVSR